MVNRPKRPGDLAQRAKPTIDVATLQAPEDPPMTPKRPQAIVGPKGGLKGGKARAKALSPQKRKPTARKT